MPRDGRIVRDRLQRAAIELAAEHGYDQTTTRDIAARAGVTERTYFRHFPDKREVFFDGEAELRDLLRRGLDDVPRNVAPLAALLAAFHAVVPRLEANRSVSEPRARVIAATPALQERELAKEAGLVAVLADALRERGVPARAAALHAQVGMDLFVIASHHWIDDPPAGLHTEVDQAFHDLYTAVNTLYPNPDAASPLLAPSAGHTSRF